MRNTKREDILEKYMNDVRHKRPEKRNERGLKIIEVKEEEPEFNCRICDMDFDNLPLSPYEMFARLSFEEIQQIWTDNLIKIRMKNEI